MAAEAFETARGSKLTAMAPLAAKTTKCANVKDMVRKQSVVIHNQIVSMQHKDVKINGLTKRLGKAIHSKKTRDGMAWAQAREKQCQLRGYELAESGKAAVDAVDGVMSIIKCRSFYCKEKERNDKHGGLKSAQDHIWVRQNFIKKAIELEGGELMRHDMGVIWPAYEKANKKTKHRQPKTNKVELPATEEEEDGDEILMASRKRAHEEEWSESEED